MRKEEKKMKIKFTKSIIHKRQSGLLNLYLKEEERIVELTKF